MSGERIARIAKSLLRFLGASALLGGLLSCVDLKLRWTTVVNGGDGVWWSLNELGFHHGGFQIYTDDAHSLESSWVFALHTPEFCPPIYSGGWIGFWTYGVSVFVAAPLLIFAGIACGSGVRFVAKIGRRR